MTAVGITADRTNAITGEFMRVRVTTNLTLLIEASADDNVSVVQVGREAAIPFGTAKGTLGNYAIEVRP